MTVPPAALVVGATGGIGRRLAEAVAAEGHRVSVTGRRPDEVTALADHLAATGAQVQPLVGDLLEPAAPGELVAAHLDRYGRLDLLVNTAGVAQRRPLAEVDVRRSGTVVEVNVLATVALLAAALPALRTAASTRPGALVVLLSSIVGVRPVAGYGLYSATKAAVLSLARTVNEEENGNGVRATALCPGFVDTPFTDALSGDFLPASDIAEALRFLLRLSPAARVPALEIGRIDAEVGRP